MVNRLGCLSLPRKSVVRLTDRPDITLDVYRGRKTTIQQQQLNIRRSFTPYILFTVSSNCKLAKLIVIVMRVKRHVSINLCVPVSGAIVNIEKIKTAYKRR